MVRCIRLTLRNSSQVGKHYCDVSFSKSGEGCSLLTGKVVAISISPTKCPSNPICFPAFTDITVRHGFATPYPMRRAVRGALRAAPSGLRRATQRECAFTQQHIRRGLASAADLQFGQPLHETHPHLLAAGECM